MSIRTSMLVAIGVLLVSPCLAGSTLSIRLVEATKSDKPRQDGVEDVADALRKSLPYNSYSLVASASVDLPARKATRALSDYTVICSGKQADMRITVKRNNKEALKTTVSLRDNKPLILGGFPKNGGKLILVFLAK